MRRIIVVLLCALALALSVQAARAQQVLTGSTGANAYYRIVVPDAWNGDLVIWNHGFNLGEPGPVEEADLGPLAQLQLAEGFAVAASSYRLDGWAVFGTDTDLKNLYDVFRRHFGVPARIIITGASLGGIVTIQAIEQGNLGHVVGGLSLCGAIAGSRNWEGALDIRLIYDAVCGQVPGAGIPGGAEGLPKGSTFAPVDLALALNACFGTPLPAPLPTPPQTLEQLGRLVKFLQVTQIPANFIGTDMGYVTFAMGNLVHDPRKLAGKVGVGNEYVDYGDSLVNAVIERVAANPGAANRLGMFYTPTGDTRGARIVSLHTDKDGLVLVENESEYAKRANPADFTAAVAVEQTPTHCGLTGAEVAGAWESLRAWLDYGLQATPASIQATCTALVPLFGGPCRIDPAFVIPDMDGRIRPRQ